MNTGNTAIICVFAVPVVAIICGTLVSLIKRAPSKESNPEDIKLIQELHQGLGRMEKRIESLETILYDQHRKEN
jgi:phage shock protein B